MTELRVYDEDSALRETHDDHTRIAELLKDAGIRLERWPTRPLAAVAGQDEVLAAYEPEVKALEKEYGFRSVDVVALRPDHPEREAMRHKFLDEHSHADFEVRFFVDGSGLFYFRLDDGVYGLECTQGDFISVPAGTRHWFDMGPEPDFKCIRFFTVPDGWVAEFTGDTVASRYPRYRE